MPRPSGPRLSEIGLPRDAVPACRTQPSRGMSQPRTKSPTWRLMPRQDAVNRRNSNLTGRNGPVARRHFAIPSGASETASILHGPLPSTRAARPSNARLAKRFSFSCRMIRSVGWFLGLRGGSRSERFSGAVTSRAASARSVKRLQDKRAGPCGRAVLARGFARRFRVRLSGQVHDDIDVVRRAQAATNSCARP